MFKIIAIELIKDSKKSMIHDFEERTAENLKSYQKILNDGKIATYESVLKVLESKEGAVENNGKKNLYKFYRNYKFNSCDDVEYNDPPIDDEYYNTEGKVKIDLCAVVGENGCGKSSLLELMIRLLNNTAYALKKGIDTNDSAPLRFVECIYARLYFDKENKGIHEICYIEQKDRQIKWVNLNKKEETWEYTHSEKGGPYKMGKAFSDEDYIPFLKSFCYTIVINYSAYALNIDDYRSEWIDNEEDRACSEYMNEEKTSYDSGNLTYDEMKCWIGSLFHKNDAYQTPIVLNPYRIRGNIDTNREKSLLNDRMFILLLKDKTIVSAMLDGKEPDCFVFDRQGDFLPTYIKRDGLFYCIKVKDVFSDLLSNINVVDSQSEVKKINEIGEAIILCWERCYGYKFVDDIKSLNLHDHDDKIAALNYIVYKTIKITKTYNLYGKYTNTIATDPKQLIMKLYCDMSHITLKLRRAIAFLTFEHYGTRMPAYLSPAHNQMEFDRFDELINEKIAEQANITKKRKALYKFGESYTNQEFKKLKLQRRGEWKREELFPMPGLKVSILLNAKDSTLNVSRRIPFDRLSSGEKQMVNSLGTMAYQLHHLNSVEGNRLQYSSVNLIFDEIDLYFHPNYQRKLIKRIIDIVNSLKMTVIKNINIIMATHSPFILSDIHQNNILYMEEGEVASEKIKINPLGANINDILHQSFFLKDGFIGEYVYKKCAELICKIKSMGIDSNFSNIEKSIESLGDPFIREQLWSLYLSNRYKSSNRKEISWLEKRLSYLKKYNDNEDNKD